MPAADTVIELALEPAAGPSLPGCQPVGRAMRETLMWHDTPSAGLATTDLALLHDGATWSLSRLRRPGVALPAPVLHSAERREVLGTAVPAMAAPVATWSGTRHAQRWTGPAGEAAVTVWRGVVEGTALGRVSARGTPEALLGFTAAAAGMVRAPVESFAVEALALAGGHPASAQMPPAVAVAPGQDVGAAAVAVVGGLTALMMHWAARIPGATGPEPVHQMRVASRRLRSALSLFGPALPGLHPFRELVRDCAARLGRARDWDVFVDGAGADLVGSFPADRRCAALVRAAARARVTAYAELRDFLAGPGFGAATVSLAVVTAVQPWRSAPSAGQPIEEFAAAALGRRHHVVRRAGRGIKELPAPALHEMRKKCKRLRYSVDVLGGLYPSKPVARLERRLAALQEELGHLNDADAVPGLLAGLGRHQRGYAAGLVVGMAEARAAAARQRVNAAWSRFRAAERFWDA